MANRNVKKAAPKDGRGGRVLTDKEKIELIRTGKEPRKKK